MIRPATPADTPIIAQLIRDLADYERLGHAVVLDRGDLEEHDAQRVHRGGDEWTGERILDPATIRPDLKIETMESVGNYAVQFTWNDGHGSGIFTWDFLRGLTGQTEPPPEREKWRGIDPPPAS